MIQRATLKKLIQDESEAIRGYEDAIRLSETDNDRELYTWIRNQEKLHKRILEDKLRKYVEKKGQKSISELLSI